MGARLLSFLSCRAYGKFGMTAVMRRADAVRPVRIGTLACRVLLYAADAQLTGVDHDQKLHQAIVDVAWGSRLYYENVFISYRLAHGNTGFLVRVVQAHGLCNFDSQPVPRRFA